jgi:acyl-coenzyme A synthetase/AMP-(fatty) acid ligase
MSIPPIFTSLCSGGGVIVPPPGAAEDPDRLMALPERDAITCTLVVPSHWSVLLERPELASLRVVAVAGEACPAELVERHYAQYPRARFWNEYGPTENSIWSTAQPLPPGRPEVVPIGRPRPGVRLHILDDRGRPVPLGVAGELHIGGTSLARGYLRRPGLTAQAFVPDPFGGEPGGRLYRTGDLVRQQQDGAVQFLGRIDHQVKVRGFRIELGEIEAALEKLPEVREAVVVAREDVPGEKRLVGYVVSDRQPAVAPAELRDALLRTLPEYMVPWAFMLLGELPRTANGKVDRKALPAPQAASAGEEYVAPRTDLERTIAEAWREVLQLPRVGVHDNFFELGGSSLLIIKLHSRLTQVLGRELSVMDLFRHPSIDALARHLAQDQPSEAPRESGAEQARARTRTRQESMRQLSQKRAQRRPRNEG